MEALKHIIRFWGGTRRFLAFVMLVLAGNWFFSGPPLSSGRFHPTDLGVDALALVIMTTFVVSTLRAGITVSRVLLLVLPSTVSLFVRNELMLYSPSLLHPADLALFQQSVYVTLVYLWLLFGWVVLFPASSAMPTNRSDAPTTLLKRINLILTAMVGIIVMYESAMVAARLSSNGLNPMLPIVVLPRILSCVFFVYLFLLFRVFLYFAPAEGQARPPETTAL